MLTFILLALGTLILLPTDAFAWGPVTHIVHGSSVLANITSLPSALQTLLSAYPSHYLYGCIGADIIQAKAYTRSVATHCHNWPVAWKIVESARSDAEKAFAWGYMTHLAADIHSHNHFVPSNLLRSFDSRTAGHAYWEARADALQQRKYWRKVREILEGRYQECDGLVESVVEHTLFSFKTNKRIFDSLMGVSKLERWQALVATVNRRSKYSLTRSSVERYNEACTATAIDLLSFEKDSYTQEQDPTGREILARTASLRRQLRMLKRRRRLPEGIETEMVTELIPELAEPSAAA